MEETEANEKHLPRMTGRSMSSMALLPEPKKTPMTPPMMLRKVQVKSPNPPKTYKIKDELLYLLKTRHDHMEVRTEAVNRSLSTQAVSKVRDEIFLQDVLAKTMKKDYEKIHKSFVLRLFAQLGSALRFLHDQRIYHMNIKPDTILLVGAAERGLQEFKRVSIKLICSNSVTVYQKSDYDPPKTVIRTRYDAVSDIDFTSPESIFIGRTISSERHDMWMLGATLYKVCTGCIPIDYQGFIDDPSGMPDKRERFVDLDGNRNERMATTTFIDHVQKRIETIFENKCELHGGLLAKSNFMRTVAQSLLMFNPMERHTAEAFCAVINTEMRCLRIKIPK